MKKLLKSKTFWTGVATTVAGVVFLIKGNTQGGVELIAGGLAMVFIRQAITKK